MFFKKTKTEAKYVPTDMKDFRTNQKILVSFGYVYDGSRLAKIRVPIFIVLVVLAPINHLLPIVLDPDIDTDGVISAMALAMLYVLLWNCYPYMLYRSSDVLRLWKQMREGFYHYTEPLTEQERIILSKANDVIVQSTRVSVVAYFCAGFGSFCREMSPESFRQFHCPYPGWFPWEVTSTFRFVMALLSQLVACLNTTYALESIFLLFAIYSVRLEGEFEVLKQHYRDTFPLGIPHQVIHSLNFKRVTVRRLKECVQHHLVIKRLHQDMLRYFGLCLLIYRVMCTIMLCLLCYLTTTKMAWNKMFQLACLACALLFLLFIFCIKGEKITKMSETWRMTVYEVNWWDHPVEVQKMVLFMLVGASKPMHIYGVWKPAMYTHGGLSDVAQESFSFFNMLRAMQ